MVTDDARNPRSIAVAGFRAGCQGFCRRCRDPRLFLFFCFFFVNDIDGAFFQSDRSIEASCSVRSGTESDAIFISGFFFADHWIEVSCLILSAELVMTSRSRRGLVCKLRLMNSIRGDFGSNLTRLEIIGFRTFTRSRTRTSSAKVHRRTA